MRFVEVADMRNSGYTVPQWLLQPVPDQDMEKVKCSDSQKHFQSDTNPDAFIAGEELYFHNVEALPNPDMEKAKCSDSQKHFQSDIDPDAFVAGEVFYFQNVEAPRCEEALKPNLSKWLLGTSPDLDADMRIKNHTCEKPLKPESSAFLTSASELGEVFSSHLDRSGSKGFSQV